MRELHAFRSALFHRLVASVGLASTLATAACGDSGGSGTGGSGGAGGGDTTTGSGGATTTTTSTTTTSSSSTTTSSTTTSTSTATGMMNVERCFFDNGAACPEADAAAATFGTCTSSSELVLAWISGPTASGTDCCYQVDVTAPGDPSCGVVGRPFMVEGRARVAPIARGARGWQARASERPRRVEGEMPAPDVTGLDDATRALLGRQWADDAAYEHASVASFGKLAMELLAFGAPADLIRAAHEAALDEIGHAAMGFSLASRYLGAPVGPGELREARSFTGAATLAELVDGAVREGCFGETAAAIVASLQHDGATDPAARATLAIIAEEEARHAELAFRVVAWAISAGGDDVRAAAHHALASALDEVERAADRARGEAPASDAVRAHGRISNGEALAARLAAGREVVVPAMARLLGAAS